MSWVFRAWVDCAYYRDIYEVNTTRIVTLGEISSNFVRISSNINRASNPNYTHLIETSIDNINNLTNYNNELLAMYEALIDDYVFAAAQYKELLNLFSNQKEACNKIIESLVAGDYEQAGIIDDEEFRPILTAIYNQIAQLIDFEKATVEMMSRQAEEDYYHRTASTVIMVVSSLTLHFLVLFLIFPRV